MPEPAPVIAATLPVKFFIGFSPVLSERCAVVGAVVVVVVVALVAADVRYA
jgi:hypothetical protein